MGARAPLGDVTGSEPSSGVEMFSTAAPFAEVATIDMRLNDAAIAASSSEDADAKIAAPGAAPNQSRYQAEACVWFRWKNSI